MGKAGLSSAYLGMELMFDITSSKLLILGIVALLVIGPKDLPALLRTIGKYMGIIKRQAAEFRAQFDEAMRETELDQMKAEVERISRETEESVRDADHAVETEMGAVHREMGDAVNTSGTSDDMSSGAMGRNERRCRRGTPRRLRQIRRQLRCRARAPAITKPATMRARVPRSRRRI